MTGKRTIPRGVWALGLVSLFMDVSSEMVHSLLPVFLVSVLGASALSVGVIEGVAECAALITRVFSGVLSDYLRRRKPLVMIGYGLSALTKPIFALATTVGWVLTARVIDRVGKGIRGAPRDALIGDIAPPEHRGASYGLRQSLDTVGAFAGPVLAMVIMAMTADDMRLVFWVAVIPAIASFMVLGFGVREPERRCPDGKTRSLAHGFQKIGKAYWWVVSAGGVLMLARFSEAFLVLRAQGVGLAVALVPMVMVVMNLAYAGTSYPAGRLSDRLGRTRLLLYGIVVLILSDLVLAVSSQPWQLFIGVGLWGVHMGLTQGILSAMVADTAPVRVRGSAFGVFNLVSGLALFLASVLAGWLWDSHGPQVTFYTGAGIATLALLGFLVSPRHPSMRQP